MTKAMIKAELLAPIVKTWVAYCFEQRELVKAYDKLHGTNLAGRCGSLNAMIDEATGKREDEFRGFIDFCVEQLRHLPPEALEEVVMMSMENDAGE